MKNKKMQSDQSVSNDPLEDFFYQELAQKAHASKHVMDHYRRVPLADGWYTYDIADDELSRLGLTREGVTFKQLDILDSFPTEAELDEFLQTTIEEEGDDKELIACVAAQVADAKIRLEARTPQKRKSPLVFRTADFARKLTDIMPYLRHYGLALTAAPAGSVTTS